MKENVKIGDLFEIETANGKAYLQYVNNRENFGESVRVFYKLFDNEPDKQDLIRLIKSEEYFYIGFALKEALKLGIVKKEFSIPILNPFPKYFRTEHLFKNNWWQIIDFQTWKRESVEHLSEEQKKLSPWGIWNDTLLIENLEKDWRLENWN